MKTLLSVFVLMSASLSAQTIQAPVFQWIPGLDLILPVYSTYTPGSKDEPGPIDASFGYDRDAGAASVLEHRTACYRSWPVAARRFGAVTHAIQLAPGSFALVHESGYLTHIQQPPDLPCRPVRVG